MLSTFSSIRPVLNRTHVGLKRVLSQNSVTRCNSTVLVCKEREFLKFQTFPKSWGKAVFHPTSTVLMNTFHTNVPQTKNVSFHKKHEEYDVVYRYPYMRILGAVSRFKIVQTTLMVVMVPITVTMAMEGDVSWAATNTVIGFGIFSTVMLFVMSNYLRKFIGVISINQSGDAVKISHLNFWGRREEQYVDINDIVPMTETGDKQGEMFKKFKLYDSNLNMYYTLRFGQIVDKQKLGKILGSME